jgi:HK97 family phage portal protein
MNAFTATFSSFGDNIYRSQTTRAAIDAIARNAAKFNAIHTIDNGELKKPSSGKLQKIISERPNPLMSAYDFQYKLFTQLFNKNNAFALIERNPIDGKAEMLIPISYSSVQAVESQAEIFMKFTLNNGNKLILPYDDLIHIRRFYYDKDLFGENNDALLPTLQLIQTVNEGMENAVQSSASLRGVLKATNVMNEDDKKEARAQFVQDYLGSNNSGGIAFTDATLDFEPIESNPILISKDQMEAIKNEVYDYFSVNDKIIQSKYTEDEWNAFYESVLEPLAIQLSQEYTNKIFTTREQNLGNKVTFESNKLAYASNETKIKLIKEVGNLGALTINEIRGILNMSPVEGGEKRVQTLNVIDSNLANEYQTGGNADEPNTE